MLFVWDRGDGIASIQGAIHYSFCSGALLCSSFTTPEVPRASPLFPVCAPRYGWDTILVCGTHAGSVSDTLSCFLQVAGISTLVGDRQRLCGWFCA
jgi:hypothetical protein